MRRLPFVPISREVPLNWNSFARRSHRWLSITFMVAVVANVVAQVRGQNAVWIGLVALLPLILLMISGLYLFILPYAARWRGAEHRVLTPSER
jgi:cellulose synthase/poly-beta-1,6-N-acetylglucosamine synthase-like glycosyltransferase